MDSQNLLLILKVAKLIKIKKARAIVVQRKNKNKLDIFIKKYFHHLKSALLSVCLLLTTLLIFH